MTNEYIEYTIKLKDEKCALSEKETIYEPLLLSKENDILKDAIACLYEKFQMTHIGAEAPEIIVIVKMIWQP